ncbi:MAG: TolC family protein [Rudaea sp.]
MLAGCSVETPLPQLRPDVPSSWHNSPQESGSASAPAPNLDSWWRAFDDAKLDALMQRALAQNLTLQQSQLRLRGARALQHRAGTQFEPQANFRSYSQPDPSGSTSYYEIGFDAEWEFGFFGRGVGNARVADADLQVAATDVEAARVSLAAEVARAYLDLCAAQARAKIAYRIVELRQNQQNLGHVQLRLHQVSQAHVDELDVALAQAKAQADAPALQTVLAQQALAVLLAETQPDAALKSVGPLPAAPNAAFAQTPANLLRTRPEIRNAELAVLRAAGNLGIAKADLYPKLSLGGSLLSSTRIVGDIDRPNKAIPSIGPLIDLPLFDWGARRDVVHADDAALQAAVLAYRQAVIEGVAEVESALAQWQGARRQLASADTLADMTTAGAARAHKLQHIGLGDANDSATADIGAAQAQLQRLDAQHAAGIAYIALYKSLGGTLPPLRMAHH